MKPSNDREAITLILEGLIERGCEIILSIDGEREQLPFTDVTSAVAWVTSCDDGSVWVNTPDGQESFVYFVLGNDPEEVACDHGVNLSQYIDPIVEPWWN